MMWRHRRTSIGLVALALVGCMDPDIAPVEETSIAVVSSEVVSTVNHEPDSIEVSFGWSAGMCEGYCKGVYTLHSWGLECTREGWDTAAYPVQRQVVPVSAGKYQAILHAVDTTSLWSEFSIRQIGCPDCADGGRCWVEVREGDALKRFDYDCFGGPGPYHAFVELVRSVALGVRWWEPGDVYVPFEFVQGDDRTRQKTQ